MAYTGSVDLISGIRQKNGQDFPLVDASAVRVDDNTRLNNALTAVDGKIAELPKSTDSDATDVDLDVTDQSGNVILRLQSGHIKTKEFDSQEIVSDVSGLNTAITNLENATVSKNQGQQHAGEALIIGSDGIVTTGEAGVSVDTTLTESGKAADAKTVGDNLNSIGQNISGLSQKINEKPSITSPEESEADLYICDQQGNVIGEFIDGHIKTKNFDSSAISADMIMEADSSEADLYICDSFGNVIAELINGHIKTKNFDSSDINSEEIDVITEDVSDLKNLTTGILGRNRDIIDGVYAACRWHQRTVQDKQFCMLLAGDIHADTVRLNSIVEFLNAIDAFDCAIMLGDIAASNWKHDAAFYTNAIKNANKPFLTCIGNHDGGTGSATDQTTIMYTDVHDLWAKFIEPNIQYADLDTGEYQAENTYYYKDFSSQKIRIIVINQYEYPPDIITDGDNKTFVYARGNECYSQAQISWFCNVLLNTPSDYGVIIALHSFPAWMLIDSDSVLTSSTVDSSNTGRLIEYSNGFIIEEIVNAWINGISLAKTWLYTVSGSYGEGINVNIDFSNRGAGEFISYIGGHWHMSILSHTHNHGQPMYTVECAGLSSAQQGDTPRKAGTMSEDCFAVFAVDRSLKTVKIFQIGAHYTKDGVDRRYGKYSYTIEEG